MHAKCCDHDVVLQDFYRGGCTVSVQGERNQPQRELTIQARGGTGGRLLVGAAGTAPKGTATWDIASCHSCRALLRVPQDSPLSPFTLPANAVLPIPARCPGRSTQVSTGRI